MKCSLCATVATVFLDLTPEEVAYASSNGVDADRIGFCNPCYSALTDSKESAKNAFLGVMKLSTLIPHPKR